MPRSPSKQKRGIKRGRASSRPLSSSFHNDRRKRRVYELYVSEEARDIYDDEEIFSAGRLVHSWFAQNELIMQSASTSDDSS
jgi:hypothetical protein